MTLTSNKPVLGRRSLGQTDITVTELGFGGVPLGGLYAATSDASASDAMDASIGAGINFFDTAPYYGFGQSERRLGDRLRCERRDSFVLSTKVGRILVPDAIADLSEAREGYCSPMPFSPKYDYSYDGVMRSFEHSLQRLGLSRIDVLLMHDIGSLTHGDKHSDYFEDAVSGGFRAMDELRSSGAIGAIGLGVNEWEICEQSMNFCDFDCFLLAGRYTLLEQGALRSFLPKCEASGASLIIGGPYNSGILAVGTRGEKVPYYNYAPAPENIIQKVAKIEDVCDLYGVPLAAAALQFPLAHSSISSVIPGLGNLQQVSQALELYAFDIPAEFWVALQERGLISEQAPVPSQGTA